MKTLTITLALIATLLLPATAPAAPVPPTCHVVPPHNLGLAGCVMKPGKVMPSAAPGICNTRARQAFRTGRRHVQIIHYVQKYEPDCVWTPSTGWMVVA